MMKKGFYILNKLLQVLKVKYLIVLLSLGGCFSSCTNRTSNLQQGTGNIENSLSKKNLQSEIVFHSLIDKNEEIYQKWKISKINTSEDILFVKFFDSQNGLIASSFDNFFQTINNGENWNLLSKTSDTKNRLSSLTFINSSIGWKSLEKQESGDVSQLTILQTMDGGQTWMPQFSDKDISLAKIAFINENEGWAVGLKRVVREIEYGEFFVLHTTDSGRNWKDVSDQLSNALGKGQSNVSSIYDIYPSESGKAVIITNENRFFKTINGGESWEAEGEIDIDNKSPRFLDLPSDGFEMLASVGGRHCCESILAKKDGNGSWTKNIISGFYLSDAIFLSETVIFACGTMSLKNNDINNPKKYGVILFSSDSGKKWQIVYQNKKIEQINSLAISENERIWAVGEKGLVLSASIKDLL